MTDKTQKMRREELEEQLKTYQKHRAADNAPHLRAAWFAVSMLLLAALSLFIFAENLEKLWALLFAGGAVAIVIGLIVRYAHLRREILRTQDALRSLSHQNSISKNNSSPAPQTQTQHPANISSAHKNRTLHRIV